MNKKKESKWIKCSKKLPPDHDCVLAYFDVLGMHFAAYFPKSGKWHLPEDQYRTVKNPTHWMPLPEPPLLAPLSPRQRGER